MRFSKNCSDERSKRMIGYIKDCLEYAKRFPFKKGDKLLIWLRNVLYVNAQPRYWYGRLITKILSKGVRQ